MPRLLSDVMYPCLCHWLHFDEDDPPTELLFDVLQQCFGDLSDFDEDDPLAGLLSDEDDDLDEAKTTAAEEKKKSGEIPQGVQDREPCKFTRVPTVKLTSNWSHEHFTLYSLSVFFYGQL